MRLLLDYNALATLVYLSLAIGVISITITRAKVSEPLRFWAYRKSEWLNKLIHCPYCMSHWISFMVVGYYFPRPLATRLWLVDWIIASLACVALAGVVCFVILKCFSYSHPPDEYAGNKPQDTKKG